MRILGIDLGGTKIAAAVFTEAGLIIDRSIVYLNGCNGQAVSKLIQEQVAAAIAAGECSSDFIRSIAISVPGISNSKEGTVWAPNIPGWDKYPLLEEIQQIAGNIPVIIESDRTCYILGEVWKGSAKNCSDAIYLAVGTGIGAGIIIDGNVIRGANDISGAIGWMALKDTYHNKFKSCGHFEYYASGEGIARLANELVKADGVYQGELKAVDKLTAHHVFAAYKAGDKIATAVFDQCVTYWGMAVANLVSLFNPQKIVLGGGIFGPAKQFIPRIYNEAQKWGQPISMGYFTLEGSALDVDAGLYGAGYAALKNLKN